MFHGTDTFYIRDNRPYSRYPPSLYALNFMIDGKNVISHGFSGGKQMIIFANTSNHRQVYLFIGSKWDSNLSHAKCTVCSFEKLIACCKDIYGRSCIPKSNNDQFYP